MNHRTIKVAFALCAAQDGRCFYCNAQFSGPQNNKAPQRFQWTRDHVVAQVRGGKRVRNLVLACWGCNQSKGDREATPAEMARARVLYDRIREIDQAFHGSYVWPQNHATSEAA